MVLVEQRDSDSLPEIVVALLGMSNMVSPALGGIAVLRNTSH